MINSSDCNLITFKAISTFINELAEIFAADHHPLKLYAHLINKTTIAHESAIKKHIDAFREFCLKNRDALTSKNYKKLTKNTVEYSSKVYVDFSVILSKADLDTKNVIWNHLLTISALVDPAGKAKEILKQESGKEADIINKVEDNIDPNNTNPMEAVSSIISSGIFTDLISGMNSGMKDGSLDLGKLMGTVQKMCSSLGDMKKGGGAAGGGDETMNMINSLVSNMVAGGGAEGGPSDSPIINIANILNIQNLKNEPKEQVSSSIEETDESSKIEEL